MIKLDDFKNNGLSITWKLLYIGFKENKHFANMLSSEDIIQYAQAQLANNEDENIINLACSNSNNIDEINIDLKKLSENDNSDYSIEYRKWRVLYVMKNLPKSNMDYIKGLVELGDIWAFLDFPEDSPHLFQGKDNNISPLEYYTIENYNNLYNKHLSWIEQELKMLKSVK